MVFMESELSILVFRSLSVSLSLRELEVTEGWRKKARWPRALENACNTILSLSALPSDNYLLFSSAHNFKWYREKPCLLRRRDAHQQSRRKSPYVYFYHGRFVEKLKNIPVYSR